MSCLQTTLEPGCRFFFFFFNSKQHKLVDWCFEPSQPLGIISGLKETFRRRYIAQRTTKAEIRPEELSEKTESCRENSCDEITVERVIKTETDTRTELKGAGQLGWLTS